MLLLLLLLFVVVVAVVVGGGVCCVFVLGCILITVFTINNIFDMILVTNIYSKYHYYNFLFSSPPSTLSPMSTFSTCTHFIG